MKDDWFTNPKTGEVVDFIDFARSEGRFAKHFDKDGNPSETLLDGQAGPARELAPAAGAGGAAVVQRFSLGRRHARKLLDLSCPHPSLPMTSP